MTINRDATIGSSNYDLSTRGIGMVVLLISQSFFKHQWLIIELALAYSLLGHIRLLSIILMDMDKDGIVERGDRLQRSPIDLSAFPWSF